jgi:bifunctional DNase/RNase
MSADEMIAVKEVHLESDPNRGNIVILRQEGETDRYFMMFVGDSEFAAIAKENGLVEPKRPLTHDLYLSILGKLRVEFLRIEIYEMREETYYASVHFRVDGTEQSVDSRPSDAVALALNRKIPILVNQSLFRRTLSKEEIKEYESLMKSVKF